MIYIVHTTHNGERAKYPDFKHAFAAFKLAKNNVHSDVALWHGSDLAQWTRVYCTEGYPSGLSRPWDKQRPHSFFSAE